MKKTMIMICCLLCIAGSAAAKGPKGKDLVGIWQMCAPVIMNDTIKEINTLPIFKIIYKDKSFMNVVVRSNNPAVVTTEGKWSANDKGVYIEAITQSITDPAIVGKENKMTYKILSDDLFSITYQLPDKLMPATEMWSRVRMHIGTTK